MGEVFSVIFMGGWFYLATSLGLALLLIAQVFESRRVRQETKNKLQTKVRDLIEVGAIEVKYLPGNKVLSADELMPLLEFTKVPEDK